MDSIDLVTVTDKKQLEQKYEAKSEVLAWIRSIIISILIIILIVTFVGTVVQVSGDSMNPNFHNGDRIIINRFSKEYTNGDVVAINRSKGEHKLIKRIIATEGQKIDIDYKKGEVYIDGKLLDEPYILEPTFNNLGATLPAVVPEGSVFVMGDNRNNSEDSRNPNIGMINVKNIMGKVLFRVFPLDKFGTVT